jgi:hypothetical protein
MRKILLFVSAMIVLAAFCLPAQAATIRGNVLEQAVPHNGVSPYGTVELDRKSGTGWSYVAVAWVNESETSFRFDGLAAGTYSLRIEGYNYVTEYYNNTTVYESRTEITVATAATVNVGNIYLNHLRVWLTNASLSGNEVPRGGGTIVATFDVVNDTADDMDVEVMVILDARRNIQNATAVHGLLQADSKSLTVPAHSTVTSTKAIFIPRTAAASTHFDVELDLTHDKWKPLANAVHLGSIYKHP